MDALGVTWANVLIWGGTALASYLMGAIPTAYLAGKMFLNQDIRRTGDGNAGAANVARTVGIKVGLAVAVIDMGKGVVAVSLARLLVASPVAEMIAGFLVIAGHNWPVFLGGRGGRGAATAVGVLLAVVPLVSIPLTLPALMVLYLTRSATKALAAFYIPLPFLALWPASYSLSLVLYSLAIPIFVGISHYLSRRRPRLSGPEHCATHHVPSQNSSVGSPQPQCADTQDNHHNRSEF